MIPDPRIVAALLPVMVAAAEADASSVAARCQVPIAEVESAIALIRQYLEPLSQTPKPLPSNFRHG